MSPLYFASLLVIFWIGVAHAEDPLCEPGEYLINGFCCPMCDSGNRVQRPCTATTSGATSCIPCMPGTYMDHPSGLTECFKCKSCDSGSRLYVKSGCSYTRNTVCSCMTGYYCRNPATEDCDGCERHSLCVAGEKVKAPGTERTNTVCEKCPTGTFSNQNMSNSCVAWTSCGDLGMTEKEPGTHLKDAECQPFRSRIAAIIAAIVVTPLFILILFYACRKRRNTKAPRGNKWEEGGPKKTETRILKEERVDTDMRSLEVKTEPEKGRTALSHPVECTERPAQRRTASEAAKPESCDGWGRENEDAESGSEEWHIPPEGAVKPPQVGRVDAEQVKIQ